MSAVISWPTRRSTVSCIAERPFKEAILPALALLLLFAEPTTGDEVGQWRLAGSTWADDPRLGRLRTVARDAARRSWREVTRELGVLELGGTLAAPAPVRWVLDGSISPSTAGAGGGGERRGVFEVGRTSFVGRDVVVSVPVYRFLARPEAVREVVAHETAHAVLASWLSAAELYEALPFWFREGLALTLSGEGETRVADRIAYGVFRGRPAAEFLQGVGPGASARPTYAEAYLTTRSLRLRIGRDGLRALVRRLTRGHAPAAALEGVLKTPLEVFYRDALGEARVAVSRRLPEKVERAFRRSLLLRAERKEAAAAVTWERLLEQFPDGPLAGTLKYLLARHHLGRLRTAPDSVPVANDSERLESVVAWLESITGHSQHLWRPEALVLLGDAYVLQGDVARANLCWREVLEVYPEDPQTSRRARLRVQQSP